MNNVKTKGILFCMQSKTLAFRNKSLSLREKLLFNILKVKKGALRVTTILKAKTGDIYLKIPNKFPFFFFCDKEEVGILFHK